METAARQDMLSFFNFEGHANIDMPRYYFLLESLSTPAVSDLPSP